MCKCDVVSTDASRGPEESLGSLGVPTLPSNLSLKQFDLKKNLIFLAYHVILGWILMAKEH